MPPSASGGTRVPLLFSLSRTGVWGGNRGDFHVQMSVSQLAAITGRRLLRRSGGLRRGLNNLAALCRRALGSQPSKVMTERRWLTSPPIHSHYHLFTVTDSRQTKRRATSGRAGGVFVGARRGRGRGELSQLYKLHDEASHSQTMTFSQESPRRRTFLLEGGEKNERRRKIKQDQPSQQSQTKEATDAHACTKGKVTKLHAAGVQMSKKRRNPEPRLKVEGRGGRLKKEKKKT